MKYKDNSYFSVFWKIDVDKNGFYTEGLRLGSDFTLPFDETQVLAPLSAKFEGCVKVTTGARFAQLDS